MRAFFVAPLLFHHAPEGVFKILPVFFEQLLRMLSSRVGAVENVVPHQIGCKQGFAPFR